MFINTNIQNRQKEIEARLDEMHSTSDWTPEMEKEERTLEDNYSALQALERRWNEVHFTSEDHINAMIRAYTK